MKATSMLQGALRHKLIEISASRWPHAPKLITVHALAPSSTNAAGIELVAPLIMHHRKLMNDLRFEIKPDTLGRRLKRRAGVQLRIWCAR